MKIFFSIAVSLSIFGFISCEKAEGPGGTSTLAGKVWVKDYTSDFRVIQREYWAEDEDVFLIYGNDTIYSDKTSTHYDGSYWFQYLNEGTYTVFVYSDDSARVNPSPSGRIPIKMTVTIDNKNSDVIVPLITIID